MKLFHWGPAPNPRRVRIFLAEKGIQVPMEDVGEGAALKESYCRSYPLASVPMLELDDGTRIGEAMAICRYFEEHYPQRPLLGRTAMEKVLVDMWERRAYEFGLIGAQEVFRNSHPLFKDRGLPVSGEAVAQIPALIERGKWRLRQFFDLLDEQLATYEFVAGPTYSVADITALCSVDFANMAQEEIPADRSNVSRWYESVSARPSATA